MVGNSRRRKTKDESVSSAQSVVKINICKICVTCMVLLSYPESYFSGSENKRKTDKYPKIVLGLFRYFRNFS